MIDMDTTVDPELYSMIVFVEGVTAGDCSMFKAVMVDDQL